MLQDPSAASNEAAPLLIGAALMVSGLVLGRLIVSGARLAIPERNNFFARWGFTKAVVVFVVFLLGQLVVPTLFASLGLERSLLTDVLLMALIFAGPAALIVKYARELDPEGVRCLGFRRERSGRAALFGVASYVLLVPGLFGTLLVWPQVLQSFGGEPKLQESLTGFFELEGGQLVLPLLFAIVILPFFEELIFRAFLQPLFVQNFREVGGVAITSLLFAGLHGVSAFLPVFALSVILGGVMLRTQRFVSCWAVHALHNGLTLALALSLPGAREVFDPQALLPLFLRT